MIIYNNYTPVDLAVNVSNVTLAATSPDNPVGLMLLQIVCVVIFVIIVLVFWWSFGTRGGGSNYR